MAISIQNWLTSALVFLVVLGYFVTSWLDWAALYKSYSPFAMPRTPKYMLGVMGTLALMLFISVIVLYPF